MGSAPQAVRCLVAGRVQGVLYRAATATKAQELGLHGFVRNLSDGRVEVIAMGSTAALGELVAWLWQGPPAARVDAIQLEEHTAPLGAGFQIVR